MMMNRPALGGKKAEHELLLTNAVLCEKGLAVVHVKHRTKHQRRSQALQLHIEGGAVHERTQRTLLLKLNNSK